MQEKILKKIIPKYAGAGSEKIVDLLHNKLNVNEFLIAKKLGLTINQTRNMLYKLSDEGLVEFIRKKDKKKGGWYTYFWTLKTKRILEKYREELDNEINNLIGELKKRQSERYYYSPTIEQEYTEEEAMLNDYTCPETGEVLELREPMNLLEKLRTDVEKLQNALAQVNNEIGDIEKKEHKAIEKKIKAEENKKMEERKKKREERKKEAKKLEKKSTKKKTAPKKKVKKKNEKKKK